MERGKEPRLCEVASVQLRLVSQCVADQAGVGCVMAAPVQEPSPGRQIRPVALEDVQEPADVAFAGPILEIPVRIVAELVGKKPT
jgi:hypothetical protein